MLVFLQALLIVALIPVLEIQAKMSARMRILSEIDESLAQKNESLSASCSRIQELNRELRMLEVNCLAAAKNPTLTAPLLLRAKSIVFEQEIIGVEMHAVASAPHKLLSGIFMPPVRDVSKPCLLSGELHWPSSLIAEFTSESGGAKTFEQHRCGWKYEDARVRPL